MTPTVRGTILLTCVAAILVAALLVGAPWVAFFLVAGGFAVCAFLANDLLVRTSLACFALGLTAYGVRVAEDLQQLATLSLLLFCVAAAMSGLHSSRANQGRKGNVST